MNTCLAQKEPISKEKKSSSSSNHQFSGEGAVSFERGNVHENGWDESSVLTTGMQLRGRKTPLVLFHSKLSHIQETKKNAVDFWPSTVS